MLNRVTKSVRLLGLGCALALSAADKAPVSLDRSRFPAKGRHEALLEVARPGRYALFTKSRQGTRLQIVDRMMGPGAEDGEVGGRDGRLDLLLDAGPYKLLATAPAKGQGDLTLEARPFTETHRPEPPVLVEGKAVSESLEDFQQGSWWIQVKERRTVYLEAQGRNLADLRLWGAGAWLLEALPRTRVVEPVKGRPERNCQLVVDLTPGTYLLTAYGGPALPWAKETGAHALHLRSGLPKLPAIGRTDGLISPFGSDRFLVPAGANAYFVSLPAKRDFRLDVGRFAWGDPLDRVQASASISKRSADPECAVWQSISGPFALVTLTGVPGETFVLQTLDNRETYPISTSESRDYRITTHHTGFAEDAIDATGLLVLDRTKEGRAEVVAEDTVHLGAGRTWSGRFNLLGENTLFLTVDEAGEYQLLASGTEAEYRLEPFFTQRPRNYASPRYEKAGTVFTLDKGTWVLSIRPQLKGILKMGLRPKGQAGPLDRWIQAAEAPPLQVVKPACTFPKVRLDPTATYTLYLNRQEGLSRGASVQPLPLPATSPVPMALAPGRDESVLLTVAQDCRLGIFTPGPSKLTCYVDGKPWTEALVLTPGSHAVWVRNDGPKALQCTLQARELSLAPEAPPTFLPPGDRQELEAHLPTLAAGAPLFLDLGVTEPRTMLLTVTTPGFYRIETTGLLKTALNLRSAVRTKLFAAEANGVGRNALLAPYLKEGDYLLRVQTLDASAGHLAVKAERTEVAEGGSLVLGREAKAEVPADQGLAYGVELPKAGTYQLRTTGQGRLFACRLEDAEGWPVVAPGTPSDLTLELPAGRYRFLNLPQDVESRRLTTVSAVPEKRRLEGKGPHALALGEAVSHRWREPAPGAPRQPDQFTFTVPADLEVRILLGGDMMQGYLRRVGTSEPPRMVRPGRGWAGPLPAGEYRLEVLCGRSNDLVDYSVKVSTAQLAPGLRRTLAVPGWVEVRLAKDSVVELFSQGQVDVRARLYEAPAETRLEDETPEPPTATEEPAAAADPEAAERTEPSPEGEGESPEPAAEPSADPSDEEGGSPTPEAPRSAPAPTPRTTPEPKTGALLDANDDSFHDWNFRIARRLPAGRYLLKVEPVGATGGTVSVGMETPPERLRETLPATVDRTLQLEGTIATFPLTTPAKGELLSVRATGASLFGCILERMTPAGPVTLVSRTGRDLAFEVATQPEGAYRLRLWSADHQSEQVRFRLWSTPLPTVDLAQLDRLKVAEARGEGSRALRIRIPRGGFFRPSGGGEVTAALGPDQALSAPEDGLLALPEGEAILRWAGAASDRPGLSRVTLPGTGTPLRLRVPRGLQPRLDVQGQPGQPVLVVVKALTGLAACAPASEPRPGLSRASARTEGSAVTVLPSGSGQIRLWDPQASGPAVSEFEIRAQVFQPGPPAGALPWGIQQRTLEAGRAQRLPLPTGSKQVDLVLEPGLTAYLATGEQILGLASALGQSTQAGLPTEATDLIVVNPTRSRGTFSVTLTERPAALAAQVLPATGLLERFESRGGTLRLEVPAAPGRMLSVAGTELTCEWMDQDGFLRAGGSFEVREGGTLHLTYGPGLVKAWLWDRDPAKVQEAERRWGTTPPEAPAPLAHHSLVALEGAAKAFSFSVAHPSALSLHWEGGGVARLRREGNGAPPPLVMECLPGGALEAYLEPGTYTLGLRALQGESLRGTARFALAPVQPLTRTRGPETLVHGGESRTFAFTLPKAGTVGIGLSAERDALTCLLLRPDGTPLGSGIQQFESLAAGTYLLRVALPPGEAPLRFTPVVVGLEAPSDGPPAEVLQAFLEQLGLGTR